VSATVRGRDAGGDAVAEPWLAEICISENDPKDHGNPKQDRPYPEHGRIIVTLRHRTLGLGPHRIAPSVNAGA
jgi:hypothetical protein